MAGIKTSIQINDGLTSVFKNMTSAINICLSSFENMQVATGEAVNASQFNTARMALNDIGSSAQKFTEDLAKATEQQEQMNKNIKVGSSAANGLLQKITGIASAYLGVQAVKGVFNTADELTQTTARLNMIVGSQNELLILQDQIFASSQRSRASYMDTADIVAKLALRAGDAFGSNAETLAFAESLNKSFIISGASQQEVRSASLQLTQALGSGVLRGEELNAVFESAPNIIQNIADYLGVPIGEIRNMASEGEITAEVVKNAMFAATDEINEKFNSMPMTWAQAGTSIKNMALKVFQPLLEQISAITQMEEFNTFVNGIITGFQMLAVVAGPVIEGMISGAAFIVDNWGAISPIIIGIASAFGIYNTALLVYNMTQAISNGLKTMSIISALAHGATITAEMAATTGMTAAQLSFNAALLACPLTWIILVVIGIIAVIYAVVAAINNAKGTSISATGIIGGVFAVLGANIINRFVVPAWNTIAAFINFFGNVFNDPVGAVEVLFYDLCFTVIGYIQNLAKGIEQLINNIPGVKVDITSGLDSFYNDLKVAQQAVKDKAGWVEYVQTMDFVDYGNAAKAGYAFGEGIDAKVGSLFNLDSLLGDTSAYDTTYDNIAATAANTGKVADSIEISEEDLKYMRDIAEREVIDRTVFSSITVDMGGVNNTVQNMADLDSIPQYLSEVILNEMAISAEGVHQ